MLGYSKVTVSWSKTLYPSPLLMYNPLLKGRGAYWSFVNRDKMEIMLITVKKWNFAKFWVKI